MKPPAFQFYPDDFIAGTVDMTLEEVGAYMRLLCYQWSTGSIPKDYKRILAVLGLPMAEPCDSHWLNHVLTKFKEGSDGLRRNERLEYERQKQAEFRRERAESGAKGAKSRWKVDVAKPMAEPLAEPIKSQWQNDGSPSPSPSPSTDKGAPAPPEQVDSPKQPRKNAFDPLALPIPDSLSTPEFKKYWARWAQHRVERKSKLTPSCALEQLEELRLLGVARAIQTIRHSIAGGYLGLFEPRSVNNGSPNHHTPPRPPSGNL